MEQDFYLEFLQWYSDEYNMEVVIVSGKRHAETIHQGVRINVIEKLFQERY